MRQQDAGPLDAKEFKSLFGLLRKFARSRGVSLAKALEDPVLNRELLIQSVMFVGLHMGRRYMTRERAERAVDKVLKRQGSTK